MIINVIFKFETHLYLWIEILFLDYDLLLALDGSIQDSDGGAIYRSGKDVLRLGKYFEEPPSYNFLANLI